MSCDGFGGVFLSLDLGIPSGKVWLEVRGARRQFRFQGGVYSCMRVYTPRTSTFALQVIHVCVLAACMDNSVLGSSASDYCPLQPSDSVRGHGLLKLFLTRIPGRFQCISRVALQCWEVLLWAPSLYFSLCTKRHRDLRTTLHALAILGVGFSSISSVLLSFSLRRMLVVTQMPWRLCVPCTFCTCHSADKHDNTELFI